MVEESRLKRRPLRIGLQYFPEDKIVIFLDNDFKKKFFDKLLGKFKRKELICLLNLKKIDTISRWKSGRIHRGKGWWTEQGIPLDKLRILCNITRTNLNEVENHITKYKAKGNSLLIKNPKIPIKESPKLFRIISHLIEDGCANQNNVNYFKNFDEKVYKEFSEDMVDVFGGIELTFKSDHIIFPIAISHILSEHYGISFGTFTAKVPKRLFSLPKEYAAAFIQGFFDDEGSFSSSCLRFYSFNMALLTGLRKLLVNKFPEIKAVTQIRSRDKLSNKGKKSKEYSFTINCRSIEYFHKNIGCTHADKKEKIKLYLKRVKRGWNHRKEEDTKKLILKLLKNKPKTVFILSKELNISEETVRSHINGYYSQRKKKCKGLLELNKIKVCGKGKYYAKIYKSTS